MDQNHMDMDQNHMDQNRMDMDQNHMDQNRMDQNHIDQNRMDMDQNHIDQNHMDGHGSEPHGLGPHRHGSELMDPDQQTWIRTHGDLPVLVTYC